MARNKNEREKLLGYMAIAGAKPYEGETFSMISHGWFSQATISCRCRCCCCRIAAVFLGTFCLNARIVMSPIRNCHP